MKAGARRVLHVCATALLFIFAWRNYTTTPRKAVNFIAHLVFSSADVLVVFWAIAYILQDRF